jgi:hypothetical protein
MGGAGDSWESFCEELKRAGRVIRQDGTPQDELTRAEGYRHLVRLIRVGFDASFEFADTAHPRVVPAVSVTQLGEGETSDARYHQAFIDGSETYHLSGHRGTAPLIEFTVYAGKIGLQPVSRQVGALIEEDLEVADDGRFEIVLSPEEHPGNWIRTEPDATMLYIRQYAHDWSTTRSASFEIRREGASGPPPPIRLEDVQRALRDTAAFVDRAAHFWTGIVLRRAAETHNVFFVIPPDPDPKRPTMPVGHRFAAGYFQLEPDQALEIGFTPTEVPYWGLDVTNFWFEPLAYGEARSHLNNRTAFCQADGSVRVVLSSRRPEAANWIDLGGHRQGTMLLRWSRSRDPLPVLSTRVVKLAGP